MALGACFSASSYPAPSPSTLWLPGISGKVHSQSWRFCPWAQARMVSAETAAPSCAALLPMEPRRHRCLMNAFSFFSVSCRVDHVPPKDFRESGCSVWGCTVRSPCQGPACTLGLFLVLHADACRRPPACAGGHHGARGSCRPRAGLCVLTEGETRKSTAFL